MTRLIGGVGVAIGVLLAAVIGWRIVVTGAGDRLVESDPTGALDWNPANPDALLASARRQLSDQQPQVAARAARDLLRQEPLDGDAFPVLVEAARIGGDDEEAQRLRDVALRRAPRNLALRASLTDELLQQHRYVDAMAQIDTLLRISTISVQPLREIVIRLAQVPEFAKALTDALDRDPPWRDGVLKTLFAEGSPAAVDQVYGGLQRTGNLSSNERRMWLNKLMRLGKWGEAYSRWVSGLALPPGTPVTIVHDGGFESEPGGIGFDWQVTGAVDSLVERESTSGARGTFAMRIRFLGRRITDVGLEQALLMAAGPYQISFRARGQRLGSDQGLEWAIACQGSSKPFATSERFGGTFDWTTFDTDFVVPPDTCPAQRLWLRNPGTAGPGKLVTGSLWLDDVAIQAAADH